LEAIELPEITDPRLADTPEWRSGTETGRSRCLWLAALARPPSLLEAIEDGLDFRYLIYGRALAAYYGRDLNGKTTRLADQRAPS
jgi:hypothetical protein